LRYQNEVKNLARQNRSLSIRPSSSYATRIDSFWKKYYGKSVNKFCHAVCASVNGIEDERYIPREIWNLEILPYLNRLALHDAYADKNAIDIFLEDFQAPITIFKKMNGIYYLSKNQPISRNTALKYLLEHGGTVIIKPSFSADGKNVKALYIQDNQIFVGDKPIPFERLDDAYGNDYIIQEKIVQHPIMHEIYPNSVNTLRMVTFRLKSKIYPLFTFARFGNRGGVVDNIGAGGLGCRINEDGNLNKYAIDKLGYKYERHPYSNYSFEEGRIPNINAYSDYVITLHHQLPYFDIVSWDIAIGLQAEPILIELNLVGDSTFYQMVSGPLFGSFTEELLEKIRDSPYRPSWHIKWKL